MASVAGVLQVPLERTQKQTHNKGKLQVHLSSQQDSAGKAENHPAREAQPGTDRKPNLATKSRAMRGGWQGPALPETLHVSRDSMQAASLHLNSPQEPRIHRGSFSPSPLPSPASPDTHVPPQNSMEVMEPAGPEGSASSSSTGMPIETTRTGSG